MLEYWDRLKPEMDSKRLEIQGLADALGISFQAVVKVREGGSFGATIAREMEEAAGQKYGELVPGYFDSEKQPKIDKWTQQAIERIQSIPLEDRKGAVMAIDDYIGKLAALEAPRLQANGIGR